MSLPRNPNLPKPPAKALPPRPGVKPPVAPPSGHSRPATPPAAPQARAASSVPAVATPRAASVHIAGLPASLASMVEAVELYDALLAEENTCLKAGDSSGVAALLDRKIAATQLYQERLRVVLAEHKQDRQLSPDQRSKVVALIQAMERRAKENALLLKANMHAIEQVIEAVNNAARKMRRREVCYSGSGAMKDTASLGGSFAFNRTI